MATPGKPLAPYVIVTGGEGGGKTTQLARLEQEYRNEGFPFSVRFTREPGATPFGGVLRQLLTKGKDPLEEVTRAMLFLCDKLETHSKVVRTEREAGNPVMTDRGMFDTIVYNARVELEGRYEKLFWHVIDETLEIPTMAVLLDIDPEEGLRRARSTDTKNKYEDKDLEFHTRINEGYRQLWAQFKHSFSDRSDLTEQEYFRSIQRKFSGCRFVTVDANPDPEAVHQALRAAIDRHLQEYAEAYEDWMKAQTAEAKVAAQ